jgi:hypothetical protein
METEKDDKLSPEDKAKKLAELATQLEALKKPAGK